MISKELKVINENGIHARPAGVIVETTSKFSCNITIIKDKVRANAKSIMNLLLLAIEPETVVRVEADGIDEIQAMDTIETLFKNKFQKCSG